MFTGIVEEMGIVRTIQGLGRDKRITVQCSTVLDELKPGDSIAVSGACLTVTGNSKDSFTADVSAETLSRTTLGRLVSGGAVNLERAMQAGGRFGGHMVQGHIDCVGTVVKFDKSGEGKEMWVEIPDEYIAYIAPKGSVTLDGISLTTVRVEGNRFSVALIPFTLGHTTLGNIKKAEGLNVEVDIIARYIKRLMDTEKSSGGLSLGKLIEEGFA